MEIEESRAFVRNSMLLVYLSNIVHSAPNVHVLPSHTATNPHTNRKPNHFDSDGGISSSEASVIFFISVWRSLSTLL